MARCERCGETVKGPADYCGCGAHAPAANSLLQGLVVTLGVAAVAGTMVYLGYSPNVTRPPTTQSVVRAAVP